MNIGAVEYKLVTYQERDSLVQFLQRPEIDALFNLPLSQRQESIFDHVDKRINTNNSFWVIAVLNEQIVGCIDTDYLGIDEQGQKSVMASTLAVDPAMEYERIAIGLGYTSMMRAIRMFGAESYCTDSWEGNIPFRKAMLSIGFKEYKCFVDNEKRPQGIRSVVYQLDLKSFVPTIGTKWDVLSRRYLETA